MEAERNILQPDLLSPVIGDILQLVEDWKASGQPLVNFYHWYDFILKPDTLNLLESIVLGKTKFYILEYFINKMSRAKEYRLPEIIIYNVFFHEPRSIPLLQSVIEHMILRNIYQPNFRLSWRKCVITEYKKTHLNKMITLLSLG